MTYYQGDLQSGISLAIQEQKLVACFVRQDGDDLSTTWEQEWFKTRTTDDRSIEELLADKAVLLRIDAGSQEARFLSAFCPVNNVPKLIIISSNGQVVEDIESSTSQQDFVTRITSRLGTSETQKGTEPPAQSGAVPSPNADRSPLPTAESDRVEALLAERAAKLEKIKREKDNAEKEARKVIAKARKDEEAKRAAGQPAVPNPKQTWIEQQRTQQQEARKDKERILRQIQMDKLERLEREQQRRATAQAEASSSAGAVDGPSVAPQHPQPGPSTSKTCALQIRLFDGTSLRTRFDSDATLASAGRAYVASQSQTDMPYNFRLMQVPGPSRTIDISEEDQTLQSLGLCPSATLVLVPVKDYYDAYASSGPTGMLYRGLGAGYGLVSGALGFVGGIVGRVTGYGADGAAEEGAYMAGMGDEKEPSNAQARRMDPSQQAGPSGVKIRTLADQRREQDNTQLYNGNQLNFEPRKDEDKDN